MEDDADWDVSLKQQLSLVAPMIRQLSNSTEVDVQSSPYGNAWDLLWLGHCGDLWPGSDAVSALDTTLPDSALYREVYGEYSYRPPQLPSVYRTRSPVCTYSYAVTSNAALKMYQLTRGGMDQIITVSLRACCASGLLRCITVNPQESGRGLQSGGGGRGLG